MTGSFEKSVKGGTKIKLAAPKSKYVEHILVATHAGEAGVAEIFRALQNRLRDSTWTIVFKSLIIVHLMIREGEPNVTLKFLADSPSKLAISNFSDVQVQGSNIRHYYAYLLGRAKAYRDTKIDWVREGHGRLKRQIVDKGLLRETETVQSQIAALLKCDLLNNEPENEITLTAFRLLTMDLLTLFHSMNEGTINVLEHYFEMSKYDAERALSIYKMFSKQTNQVVEYLSTARQYEHATRLDIPKLKHAPTSLTASLEEYLNDPDFEVNRRQYLAQQEAKRGSKKPLRNGATGPSEEFAKFELNKSTPSQSFPEPKTPAAAPVKQAPKAPAPDLIDFFESIEETPQSMTGKTSSFPVAPYPQQAPEVQQPSSFAQNGQVQQQDVNLFSNGNPFGQMQTQQPVQPNVSVSGISDYAQQPYTQQQNSIMPQTDGNGFVQPQQSYSTGQQLQQQQAFSTEQHPQQQLPFNNGQQPQPQLSFNTGQQSYTQQPFGTIHQPQQQSPFSTGLQSQPTNPFRKSTMPQDQGSSNAFTNTPSIPSIPNGQSSNPFARNLSTQPISELQGSTFISQPPNQGSPFTSQPPQSTPFNSPPPQQQQSQAAQPLQPMRTGTNPFARNASAPQQQTPISSPLVPHLTGSTNPFRQSQFISQQTGQGWQAHQGSMGGLEEMPTIPVFPRPGQQNQSAQQSWP